MFQPCSSHIRSQTSLLQSSSPFLIGMLDKRQRSWQIGWSCNDLLRIACKVNLQSSIVQAHSLYSRSQRLPLVLSSPFLQHMRDRYVLRLSLRRSGLVHTR